MCIRVLLLFSLLAWSSAGIAQNLTPSDIFKLASPSIVVVRGLNTEGATVSIGSGVTIGRARIVTNCHVFTSAHSAEVDYQGRIWPAALEHVDVERDLCSFVVNGLPSPAAMIGTSEGMEIGSRVYAIGSPRGFSLTLSDGLLSGLRDLDGGAVLQITAPISPGSSGGGLFDDSGRLVGITSLFMEDSQQLNFAVPVEWINQLGARSSAAAALQARALEETEASKRLAVQQLTTWEEQMIASDPSYLSKKAELAPLVSDIGQRLPPSQWLEAVRNAYARISAISNAVSVSRIELGRAIDASNQIIRPTTTFLPHDTMYASVHTTTDYGAPVGGTLTARWTYEDYQLVDKTSRKLSFTGSGTTAFSVQKPDGWPSGEYKVEIFLNGNLARTSYLTVP